MARNNGTPTLADFQRYQVNRQGEAEVIRQSLYDYQVYATAGATILNFFQNPQGAGKTSSSGAVAGSAKTIADTNLELAGQLPNPKGFLMESIEVDFYPGSVATADTFTIQVISSFLAVAAQTFIPGAAANDVNAVYSGGELQFFIGSKPYLDEAPLKRFPPKAQFVVDAAMASNSATTGEVGTISVKAGGRPYFMQPPVSIMATQNFKVSLNWPVAIATPSGFNGRIGVILDGYLFRNSQ
jgi:hypothetical protein